LSGPAGYLRRSGDAAWRSADGAQCARPFGNCYWLWPGRLLAGEHPGYHGEATLAARVQALRRAGISRFVDLTARGDPVPPYGALLPAADAQRHSHPVTDFGVPDRAGMQAILATIDAAIEGGQGVYLHCRAGIGRTGTVAAIWLIEQGLDAEQALDLLQLKWQAVDKHGSEPHTPETDAQRAFVRAWTRRAR